MSGSGLGAICYVPTSRDIRSLEHVEMLYSFFPEYYRYLNIEPTDLDLFSFLFASIRGDNDENSVGSDVHTRRCLLHSLRFFELSSYLVLTGCLYSCHQPCDLDLLDSPNYRRRLFIDCNLAHAYPY